MIVTVTPNPSLDRTYDVGQLVVGEVNRAVRTHLDPGGKGINVSRTLVRHARPTVAVLPVGGSDGAELVGALDALGVPTHTVAVGGGTRSNVAVVDGAGVTTKINAAGPALGPGEVAALVAAVEHEVDRAGEDVWVVLAGSVPAGAQGLYPRLVEVARSRGASVAVDASGADLAGVVASGGTTLLKPNLEELSELLGESPVTVGEIVACAHRLLARGHRQVLVSLGPDGALLVDAAASWWAGGAPLVPRSTVGAGDCTLAGFLGATGDDGARLRTAVAWGRAATSLPGSAVPAPLDVREDEVDVVRDPDPAVRPEQLAARAASSTPRSTQGEHHV